jgi:hypothetical protein
VSIEHGISFTLDPFKADHRLRTVYITVSMMVVKDEKVGAEGLVVMFCDDIYYSNADKGRIALNIY